MDAMLLSSCIDHLPDSQRLHLADVENLQQNPPNTRGLIKTPSINGTNGFLAGLEAVRGGPLSSKNVWTTAAIAPQAPQPVQLPLGGGAFHSMTDFWPQGASGTCHPQFAAHHPYTHFPDDAVSLESQFRAAEQLHSGDLLGHARMDLLQFSGQVPANPHISSPLGMQSLAHNLHRPGLDLPAIAPVQTVAPSLASPLPTDLHMDLQQQFNELEYRNALKNVLVENVHLHKQLEVAISPSSSDQEDSLRQSLAARHRENSQLSDELVKLRSEKEAWLKEKATLMRELQQHQSTASQHDATEKQLKARNEQLFQETQQLAEALQQLTNRNLALLEEVETHKRSKQRIRQEASRAEERVAADEAADQASCRALLEQALQNAEERAKTLVKENHETTQVLKQLTEQTQALLEENARLSTCHSKSEHRLKELTALIASSENGSDSVLDMSDVVYEGIIDCTGSVHCAPDDNLSISFSDAAQQAVYGHSPASARPAVVGTELSLSSDELDRTNGIHGQSQVGSSVNVEPGETRSASPVDVWQGSTAEHSSANKEQVAE